MPAEKAIVRMKHKMHPLLIERIMTGYFENRVLQLLGSLQPDEFHMKLEPHFPDEKESFQKQKKVASLDSYDGAEANGRPVFTIEGWYMPANLIRRTDVIKIQTSIDIDPHTIAEVIASIGKTQRTTAANALVASYVEENGYLEDVLEDENDEGEEDEDGDAMDYDEWLEHQDEMQELLALIDLRQAIIAGTFDISLSPSWTYDTDQLTEGELYKRENPEEPPTA